MEIEKFHCRLCKEVISDKILEPYYSRVRGVNLELTVHKKCPYCGYVYTNLPLSERIDLEKADWVSVVKYGINLS